MKQTVNNVAVNLVCLDKGDDEHHYYYKVYSVHYIRSFSLKSLLI